jgi:pyridinium-3,5-biscarboxylic acid mononucleotide synthase
MQEASTRAILEKVRTGKISVDRAEKFLRLNALSIVGDIARLDINRHLRRGVPEIVYAEGKSSSQLEAILSKLFKVRKNGNRADPIIISKVTEDQLDRIRRLFERALNSGKVGSFADLRHFSSARIVSISFGKRKPSNSRGRVALLSAGTSDIPALDEAEAILSLMGCRTIRFNDIGIASLERLRRPLTKLEEFDPDAIVVAAGMEAALPSLIAGLSSVPVVALPTSVGFGYGGKGEAALMSVLQACPLGICTVNIDGGVAAGIVSWLIAKRCSEARSRIRVKPSLSHSV